MHDISKVKKKCFNKFETESPKTLKKFLLCGQNCLLNLL